MSRLRRVVATLIAAVALFASAIAPADAAVPRHRAPRGYVALGDSYAAGPFIPDLHDHPVGCARSTNDYAHLVRPAIAVTYFVDVTCSGATSGAIFGNQDVVGGPHPPQGDVLNQSTKVVTFQFGGNDIGFGEIVQSCISLLPWAAGCAASTYQVGGRDLLRERVQNAGPRIARALDEVQRRAPHAEVFVVGYPAILPESGSCWSLFSPIVAADVAYLRGVLRDLNAAIAARAAAAGAVYIDIYTPTIGHDICKADRWIEPVVPSVTTPAFPVHPNIKGMRAWAALMSTTINRHVPA